MADVVCKAGTINNSVHEYCPGTGASAEPDRGANRSLCRFCAERSGRIVQKPVQQRPADILFQRTPLAAPKLQRKVATHLCAEHGRDNQSLQRSERGRQRHFEDACYGGNLPKTYSVIHVELSCGTVNCIKTDYENDGIQKFYYSDSAVVAKSCDTPEGMQRMRRIANAIKHYVSLNGGNAAVIDPDAIGSSFD